MIKFAKKNDSVKIPSKLDGDAGRDIYANFDAPFVKLNSHETTLVPTGIFSCFENDIFFKMENRGSNGSKGLLQACGVVDSTYRGEWFVAITNTTNHDWYIMKKEYQETIPNEFLETIKDRIYPYEKAICQFVILPVPDMSVSEISLEDLKTTYSSERGDGKLGSSGK